MHDPPAACQDLWLWSNGDAQAGRRFVAQHIGVVARFFERKLHGASDDQVQNTFETALRCAKNYRGTGSVRAFLLGIARNVLLEHLRRVSALHRHQATLEAERSLDEWTQSASAITRAREQNELLALALRRIPLDEQIAIELYYWEGLDVAEVAESLNAPPGTIKYRLANGRRRLKVILDSELPDAPLRRSASDVLDQWARAIHAIVVDPR